MEIFENEEWWCFEAGLPNKQFFDDGAGSIYVNKKEREYSCMAKRKGKSGSGEGHYIITQANLDKKGKTNKKLNTKFI